MHQPSNRVPDTRVRCTHAFPDAHRCGSPALRGQSFCYYHHPSRQRVTNPNERRARRIALQSFTIPLPTNRAQLQRALVHIAMRITTNRIDNRRAGLLLFALQSAAKNLTQ